MSDKISREAAIEAVCLAFKFDPSFDPTIKMATSAIRALPAVQPDLTDPNVVHANMLRGTIAKPTVDQIRHIYGDDLPDAAAIREAALREAADSLLECSVWCDSQERTDDGWRNGVADARKHHMARILALINNTGKEVMPDDPIREVQHTPRSDIGPGDQAVAGAAGPFRTDPEDWSEDFAHEKGNYMCCCATCGKQFFGYKRRVTCRVCAQPEPVAGAAHVTDAVRDVLAERQRQISEEGWTPEHDDAYQAGDLANAAACYAMTDPVLDTDQHSRLDWPYAPTDWPWPAIWWKPTNRRRNLVKAGALILAEIERLDRAALAQKEDSHE
jgi:hypothetical protein